MSTLNKDQLQALNKLRIAKLLTRAYTLEFRAKFRTRGNSPVSILTKTTI